VVKDSSSPSTPTSRFGNQVRGVVDRVPVDAELHFEVAVDAVAEGQRQADVVVQRRRRTVVARDVLRILVDQLAAELPARITVRVCCERPAAAQGGQRDDVTTFHENTPFEALVVAPPAVSGHIPDTDAPRDDSDSR
jgi:hypothetical protein